MSTPRHRGVMTEVSSNVAMSPGAEAKEKYIQTEGGKEDSPAVEDGGLVSNNGLTDEEIEHTLAPDYLVEEEERLRKQREEAAAAKATTINTASSRLEEQQFKKLNELLNQTGMYAKFLAEQLVELETAPSQSQTASNQEQEATKGKRKKSVSGSAAKKQKAGPSPTQELCPLIQGELREYQLKGIKWLISLYQNGLSGILADQMGLGKTVQTIGFLSHLRSKGLNGPFLVLGPLSTLPNWVNEFQKWCPSMKAILYHGTRQERQHLRDTMLPISKVDENFPVIVTSYEIVLADSKFLQKYKFKYIVVDEGHRLKNSNCRLLRELRMIEGTANKLLLTGTPLQNSLAELWSLLHFLLPDIFSSLQNFESWFDIESVVEGGGDGTDVATEQRATTVSKLHDILRPFLLRRIKGDVELCLPRKSEIIMYAPMTPTQRQINQQLLEKNLLVEMLERAREEGVPPSAAGKLNNMLMQMRKNCNHPDLITSAFSSTLEYPPPEELVRQCGKMALLDRLLKRLLAADHKVLIFSQMTSMLDIIESYLEQSGRRALRIDGSVPWQTRQANINEFNGVKAGEGEKEEQDDRPPARVFLLSTRAGGLGLNLTAADTVIIYDSDWNPQQDLQAMDRCHRIGQTRPVLVFRLATAHSVEGQMLRRAADKMKLERLVIRKGVFKEVLESEKQSTSMNASELLALLRSDKVDDVAQSGAVSDDVLTALLDRTHLAQGKAAPYPASGVGYEVVQSHDSAALLSGVQ